MNIEIAIPDRMAQSGKSLLRLMQNNSMPTLDLFVRESIQNSLDARNGSKENVKIDFFLNTFEAKNLSCELEGITEGLRNIFTSDLGRYLAIKDSNTFGLTGELNADCVKNNEYGNLLKLVYEISKAKDSEGSGGSWGLGKTVYFRVGIGLVIYYSRIKLENGKYESRLVACFVEDETSRDAIIPKYNEKNKRGIAWWGKKIDENKTIPITNEEEIEKIIKYFNKLPIFEEKETGTMIIIPYIDEKKLLQDIDYDSKTNLNIPWCKNIEEYLKLSVQKWYIPRLNNEDYDYGEWMEVRFNNIKLSHRDIYPYFSIIQSLYNRASLGDNYIHKSKNKYSDYIEHYNANLNEEDKIKVFTKEINRNSILDDKMIGRISFLLANKKILQMLSPNNCYSPFIYLNLQKYENNRPIITFTRKPGMLVSYETGDLWTKGIQSTNEDEYIIGVFTLNSKNRIKETGQLLEEYIRKSEKADHTSWEDYNISNKSLKIVSKIQDNISKKISEAFIAKEIIDSSLNSSIGSTLAKILLPPQGFGRKSGVVKSKKLISKGNKKASINRLLDGTKYLSTGIELPFEILVKENINKLDVFMQIETETNKISANQWESEIGILPSTIESLEFKFIEQSTSNVINVNGLENEYIIDNTKINILRTRKNKAYGFQLEWKGEPLNLLYKIKIKVLRKDAKVVFDYNYK